MQTSMAALALAGDEEARKSFSFAGFRIPRLAYFHVLTDVSGCQEN